MSDDSADKIRQQMRDIRRDMGADVKDIVHSAQQLSDWRYYVRKYPWLCVGSAFAIGLLAAPHRRKALSAEWEKLASQLRQAHLGDLGGSRTFSQGLVGKLLAVAGPIAVRGAANFLASRLGAGPPPGGEEEEHTLGPLGKPR